MICLVLKAALSASNSAIYQYLKSILETIWNQSLFAVRKTTQSGPTDAVNKAAADRITEAFTKHRGVRPKLQNTTRYDGAVLRLNSFLFMRNKITWYPNPTLTEDLFGANFHKI